MQQNAAKVHLNCSHFSLDQLLLLHAADLEHPELPVFVILDRQEERECDELDEYAAQDEGLCHLAAVQPVESSRVAAQTIQLVQQVIVVDWEGQRQITRRSVAQDLLQTFVLRYCFLHAFEELEEEELDVAEVEFAVVLAVVMLGDDDFGRFGRLYAVHFLFCSALAHLLRYSDHVPA